MERISIPFAAGVALSATLSEIGKYDLEASTAIFALAITLIFIFGAVRKAQGSGLAYIVCFFAAGIFCHASASLAAETESGLYSPVSRICGAAAESLKQSIDALSIGDPRHNALLKALLTGDRSGLPRELSETFRAAGASHILALSGLHMGILYSMLAKLTFVMGNSPVAGRIRSVMLVAAAAFYTVMTGAGPSIVRAFLFILLSEICRCLPGRQRNPARILQAALIIQLSLKPTVISSLGFQLSYLALCGIVWLMPRMNAWYPSEPGADPLRKLWEMSSLSISCQCMTAPLIWLRFKTFPHYFIVTNLVAMPLTTLCIGSAIFCLATGNYCPEPVLRACGHCIGALIYVLEVIASL